MRTSPLASSLLFVTDRLCGIGTRLFSSTSVSSVHPILEGCGISSLSIVEDSSSSVAFYAGSKRGALLKVLCGHGRNDTVIERVDVDVNVNIGTTEQPLSPQKQRRPSPIHSMARLGIHSVACGGGDRFVTVHYGKQREMLGPHTGWVRDVVYLPSLGARDHEDDDDVKNAAMMFSIGCDRIVAWRNKGGGGGWSKEDEVAVDSSPEYGSTLSADLLCLCLVEGERDGVAEEEDPRHRRHPPLPQLFAGGVDGRIHRWTIHRRRHVDGCDDPMSPCLEPIGTPMPLHGGRVNRIVYGHQAQMVVSVANDGTLVCSTPRSRDGDRDLAIKIKVAPSGYYRFEGENVRLTALCTILDARDEMVVAVGTSRGRVHMLQCLRLHDADDEGAVQIRELGPPGGGLLGLEENSVVHDLVFAKGKQSIIVAHSNGIAQMDIPNLPRISYHHRQ